MPFQQAFERRVNDDLQEDSHPSRALPEEDIKKMPSSPQHELEDEDLNEQKDRPPRFSTLFGATNPPPAQPEIPRHYQQEYYPRPSRRSGVNIPTPLFVLFAIILFFESTILFAYTVIGLYNNAPSRLLPWAGPGIATACDCGEKQAAVNFAPNFVMGGVQPVSPAVGVPAKPELQPSLTSTSTTASSSSLTTPPTTSSTTSSTSAVATSAAAAASDIAGILGGLTTSSTAPPSLVTSIKLVTSVALPTVTTTDWVPGATITASS